MRIIAGRWRSRKLTRPTTDTTRPMPDRVKEAIFNMLGVYFGCPGCLPEFSVADVFAGSGSLGLEALSRGAACCTFFERNKIALDSLRRNLDVLGVQKQEGVVIKGDAWNVSIHDARGRFFDLVFLDPPYQEAEDITPTGSVRRYLAKFHTMSNGQVKPLIVLHHSAKIEFELDTHEGWRILERRRFGTNAVVFIKYSDE